MTTEWEAWEAQFTDVDVSAIEREESVTAPRDPIMADLYDQIGAVADRLGATDDERRVMSTSTQGMSPELVNDFITRAYECARVRVDALKASGNPSYGTLAEMDSISILNSLGLIISLEMVKQEVGHRMTQELATQLGEDVIIVSMGLALGELVFGWSFKDGEPPRCALVDTQSGTVYQFKVVD